MTALLGTVHLRISWGGHNLISQFCRTVSGNANKHILIANVYKTKRNHQKNLVNKQNIFFNFVILVNVATFYLILHHNGIGKSRIKPTTN